MPYKTWIVGGMFRQEVEINKVKNLRCMTRSFRFFTSFSMTLDVKLLLYRRVVTCIQAINDFVSDVVCRVAVQQVVECSVADDQVITLSFVVNLEE